MTAKTQSQRERRRFGIAQGGARQVPDASQIRQAVDTQLLSAPHEAVETERRTASPLRIALFSGNYNYVMDGPVRALNRLVSFLQSEGHEVLVFAPTTKTPACEHAGDLISVPSLPLPGRSEYRLALGLPRLTRTQLEAFKPDLFHLSAPDWLGHAAQRLARNWSLPTVASFHTRFDTYARYYGGAWIEPCITSVLTRFYNRCDQVYAPSASMLETLKDQGVKSDLRLWSRGVDRAEFDPALRDPAWRASLGIGDHETLVIFVGRLVLEKGLDKLIDAYRMAEERDAPLRFLVVGGGPERERLEAAMPNAAFTGHLSGRALGRAYASADIFFNPSVTETFGNVTLEALASALPVVSANATGSRSIVVHGRTGLVSGSGSSADFFGLLQRLAAQPKLRAEMGAAARAESSRYDWNTVLRGLLGHYHDVLNCCGPASPAPNDETSRLAVSPKFSSINRRFGREAGNAGPLCKSSNRSHANAQD